LNRTIDGRYGAAKLGKPTEHMMTPSQIC